jgi:hypothetical protein
MISPEKTLWARYGGLTARVWLTTTVKITTGRIPRPFFSFDLSHPSKGGGEVEIRVDVRPCQFQRVIEAMVEVDRDAAIDAFAAVLKRRAV